MTDARDSPTAAGQVGDRVAELVGQLRDLLVTLAALLPEPVADPAVGQIHRKMTGSPAPWHAEAAAVLFDVHEGVRRLEASMRRDVTGALGCRRGGSDGNTAAALDSIVQLAFGLDDQAADRAARVLAVWVSHARTIRDIDTATRWEPLPRATGQLPAACPYCGTLSLRWARHSGAVRCANPACADSDGQRPYGRMEYGPYTGRPMLVFADGREIITYQPGQP